MSSERPLDISPHRFFRAMVLMGSGIALGCGGIADDAPHTADVGGTGGTTGGTGGTTGGTGGTTGGTAGTTAGTGGTTAGTGAGGAAGTGGNLDCSPSQWTCSPLPLCATGSPDGYVLPSPCTCDLSRPLSGAECESGKRVCLNVTTNPDGTVLSAPIPVQCSCAPDPTSCATSCHAAFPDGDGHSCTDVTAKILPAPLPPTEDDILCGCSFVFLR